MTEEEAREKVCKIVPVCVTAETKNGRTEMTYYEMPIRCVASGCMKWRWLKIWDEKPTRGYCGLGREVIHG